MGIHGLAKLIADQAPGAIKEHEIKSYFGLLFNGTPPPNHIAIFTISIIFCSVLASLH